MRNGIKDHITSTTLSVREIVMPAKKLETVVAGHLSSLIDYDIEAGESALEDAHALIKLIEKSGFDIVRRASPSTRARLSDRRGHRAR